MQPRLFILSNTHVRIILRQWISTDNNTKCDNNENRHSEHTNTYHRRSLIPMDDSKGFDGMVAAAA